MMPTILGLCGVAIPNSVEGLDYSGYLQGGKNPSDGATLISCAAPFGQWPRAKGGREYRGIRTLRYTYVRDLNGPWLLFDNEKDPYQLNNLVAQPEQVNVAVAQNLRDSDGKVTNMSQGNARGRSFHGGKKETAPGAVNRGYNFAEQWQRALEMDPPFVMVTGWNEWTAGKFSRPGLPVVFVDQFDQEYSRDIEPVAGLHNDNYYYQLVANVRRYKGFPALAKASAVRSIDVASGFEQWREVGPEFTDHAFDNDHRDFGLGARHYTNSSGRNDLKLMKVARDATHIYFYVQTQDTLTSRTDPNWMWLLIDADQNPKTGWEGYDFIVNRTMDGKEAWLERNMGGWKWEKAAKVQLKVEGSELMLAVSRAAMGLAKGAELSLDFKWWDNPQRPGDIMDTYLSGDVAPDGRFNYRYVSGGARTAPNAETSQPKSGSAKD